MWFELRLKPMGANNLYANARNHGGRFARTEVEVYKQHVIDAALDAADRCGWDLAYEGFAEITIIELRKGERGLDWDGIPKAIQDALQPQIVVNDRRVWSGRVLIAEDAVDPRIIVIVAATTKERLRTEALKLLETLGCIGFAA